MPVIETAGLAVGALALAGLFNNAVDAFEYIHLAKNFGTDFQNNLLKLDVAQLRLSRWGEAIGLGPEIERADPEALSKITIPTTDEAKTKEILQQTIKLFDDAAKVSKRLSDPPDDHPGVNLDPTKNTLHKKLRTISNKRRGNKGLVKRTKWALSDSKKFKSLVKEVTEFVGHLEELAPSTKAAQKQLYEKEIVEVSDQAEIQTLKAMVDAQDPILEEVVGEMAQSVPAQDTGGTVSITGGQHSGFILGNNHGTLSGFHWGGK